MANKQRGMVGLKLDKARNIRFTLNSLAELEDSLGIPLSELGNVAVTMKTVRAMLWAGLIHEDKKLTIEQVGDMVDFDNFEEVQQAIGEAFEGSMGKKQ